jgi:hypothetical protein
MTRARQTALLLVLLVAVLVAAVRVDARPGPRAIKFRPSAASCGGNLWRMKTLSDVDRNAVRMNARATTLASIAARQAPRPTPRRRRTPFQRQIWEVVAQITEFRSEPGELRLTLWDDGTYINAAIPIPECLTGATRDRHEISGAWYEFVKSCAKPTSEWQSLGAVAYVRGVGFWSQRRTTHGAAANGAELHPVTSFRVVAGCA